ncbi:MAG: two-component regulator propeller domain-containing protein [Chitinophagaceae bacterium]
MSFFLIVSRSLAQEALRFTHLSTENGLSQNSVLAIAQDKDGFIWMGTQSGLNRYDAHSVKRFYEGTKPTDLKGEYILSLYRDRNKQLWIGTNRGLHLYHPENETFTQFIPGSANVNYHENEIMDIAEDAEHTLWIGTKNGLLRFYPRQRRFEKIIIDGAQPSFIVYDVHIDQQGRVWLATSDGLYILKKNAAGQPRILQHLQHLAAQANDAIYTAITEDAAHNFWLGTMNHGLFKLDGQAHILHNFSATSLSPIDNHIRKLLYTTSQLYVATQNGLFSLSFPDQTVTANKHIVGNPKSLAKNSLYSLFNDRDGSLWVGSYYSGVSIASNAEAQFLTWPEVNRNQGLSDPVISGITKDKTGNLWISTEGNGLVRLSPDARNYQVYNSSHGLSTDLLKNVYLDENDILWMGTHGGGINTFSLREHKFVHYPIADNTENEKTAETYCITSLGNNQMLFGGNYGLKIGKTDNGKLLPQSLSTLLSIGTRSILTLQNGRVIIGTNNGLFTLVNNKATRLQDHIGINCMVGSDGDSLLWMGTPKGLYTYHLAQRRLRAFGKDDFSYNILAINKDQLGNIWMSTNNGLYNIDKDSTVRHYTVGDGLASNQFDYNATGIDNKGQLFFGGNEGLTYFRPDAIRVNQQVPPLLFTDITVLDTTVNQLQESLRTQLLVGKNKIKLNHKQNSFTVNFALLNYIKPDKNHYQYQLLGYDKSWRTTNLPSATYINLAPGQYELVIKGFNNDNIASAEQTLQITVLPPWWATWWAYCIYIVVLASLVFGTVRYFALRYFYRKEEEIHQKKLDFFTNISHEIRTYLTLIIGPLSNLRDKEDASYPQQTITDVENNANHLLSLVNELMDFRKMESGNIHLHIGAHDINLFLKEIHRTFVPIAEAQRIDFGFFPSEEAIMVYFDKRQMEKVFFNLLSNAFKFTPKEGKIAITVQLQNEQAFLTVADNGKGIDPAYKGKIFENYFQVSDHVGQNSGYGIGLALSKKIVELHHGDIRLSQPKDKTFTTQFAVSLKTGTAHFQHDMELSLPTMEITDSNAASNIAHTLVLDTNHLTQPQQAPHGKKKNLLVVEDNPRMQQLLSEILSSHYQVTLRDNAENGMGCATEQVPDLIVSDVMMPGMDGFQFCAQLKQNLTTSHIPVILLTAKSTVEDCIEGLDNSADVYLTKPFNAQVLLLHIRNLLVRQEYLQQKIRQEFLSQKNDSTTPVLPVPNTPQPGVLKKQDEEFLNKLKNFVESNLEHPDLGVQMLEKECTMSAPVLYKKVQALTGCTIHEFIKIQRLQKACMLLKENTYNITEITYQVGYSDRKYFSKEFKKHYGITPSEYQKKEFMQV